MLNARHHLKITSLIHQYRCRKSNFGAYYSQKCDVDECNCPIPQPKCKKRSEVVKEVDCQKCIFDCWEYKPRPRFVAAKTQAEQRKEPRECTPTMKAPAWRNVMEEKKKAELCRYMNRTDASIGHCPKTEQLDIRTKDCEENPFKFEDEKIPLPDWDFNKKPETLRQ